MTKIKKKRLIAFLSETGKLFASVQGCKEEGTIPQAPNYYGGAE